MKGIRRMADPDVPYPPSAHPPDMVVKTYAHLARWLGGDETSWTGDFLHLVAKSDPQHREALRRAAPRAVRAWEVWNSAYGPFTGAELASLVDGDEPERTT